MKNLEGQKLLTADEAAKLLSISKQTLYNLKCKGKIRGFNMGGAKNGKLFFLEQDVLGLVLGNVV